MGLAKTTSQQYVLEHCPVTGIVFTSGCDGTILSFTIETTITSDSEQPQYVLATAIPIGEENVHIYIYMYDIYACMRGRR